MKRRIIYILGSIIALLLWEYIGSHYQTARLLTSSPSLVFEYFLKNTESLMIAMYTTFVEAAAGLIIATLFSFLMMIICFYRPNFMEFILPLMITSQVVPIIVLAPFFIILLGFGMTSKIVMAAVISFFPIFVNFAQGYKSIDTNIHEFMDIHNASLLFRIKRVYFPLSLPSIMAGLKVSATFAVIGAIVAEFVGAPVGLGKNLFISAIRLEPDLMMSSLILSTVIGLLMFGTVITIEKKLGKWYE